MQQATTQLLGPSQFFHRSGKGTIEGWAPSARMIVSRVSGYLVEAGAMELEALMRRQFANRERHTGFHDWFEMTDYDSRARIRLTDATMAAISQIDTAHVLLRSQAVAFGVRAANLVVRRIRVHTEEATFEQELRQALAKNGVIKNGVIPVASASNGR